MEKEKCPLCLCEKHMGKQSKKLYEIEVCSKCYYAFANRRQFAFVLDIIMWNILVFFTASFFIYSIGNPRSFREA